MFSNIMTPPQKDSIDVIIPARGHAPWLQSSLESIASQSLQPKTIVVVDDGLEHKGPIVDLGKHFFGARFRLLKNDGRGISAALNTAVQQSVTHWIARMDADDIAYPDRLEQQILFLRNSAHDVLGCGTQVRFINSRGHPLEQSVLPTSWEEITRQIQLKTCFVHSSLVIRRDALLMTPYRSTLDGAEDMDLILRLSERGKILNLHQVLLDYRMHLRQESFRLRARQTALQELVFRLAARRRKNNLDPLDYDPSLAENFIQWRLSMSGYTRCRMFLTALRYMKAFLSGGDFRGFTQSGFVCLKSLPVSPAALSLAWRIYKRAGAALVDGITPFNALNID
jgi:glycosyltransferase involved in cell wall biosynthesis